MTVDENGSTEEAGGDDHLPKLASISTKGMFAEGEDVTNTPPVATPNGGRGFFSPRTPSPTGTKPMTTKLSSFLEPSRTFARLSAEKEEVSKITPSIPSHSFTGGFKLPLVGEVKPRELYDFAILWLHNPKNLVLLLWGVAVGISGAILFMVMVGMLNGVLTTRTQRNTWFEVSNQIINALFTLMVLYLHPQRCLHVHKLYRWTPSDIVQLRKIYCKHGTRKPHEWGHILVVVMLLQLNCFAQYALCGLNWGYTRSKRPALGVAICLVLAIGGAAAAGIYNSVSPLGKDFALMDDPEDPSNLLDQREHDFAPRTRIYRMLERRVSFASRREGIVVETPQWKGGLFDVRDEPVVSVLSTVCCVCVFGWNMERLGFGNRYVHIVTFVLICTAPFWIFDLAAVNIENRTVRYAIGGTGIALCGFGLLYGGYWRIRMRERFKLPAHRFCCNNASATDCFRWLFFPFCSLCQEVRTAEEYDIKDDNFYLRHYRPPLNSPPPPGFASPHSPGPTLAAVKEVPDSLHEMNQEEVELRAMDSPYTEDPNPHRNPLAAPTPVTASRSPLSGTSPLRSSPSSPNPFLNSPTNNPFLQPELYSNKGASPIRSHSPFNQVELTSQASEALMRSPIRPPHPSETPPNALNAHGTASH